MVKYLKSLICALWICSGAEGSRQLLVDGNFFIQTEIGFRFQRQIEPDPRNRQRMDIISDLAIGYNFMLLF